MQRYIDQPLLLDGIKFDLRVYVVVVGFNPVQAFIYDEGLARFCTVSFYYEFSQTSHHLGQVRSSYKIKLQESIHALDKLLDQQGKRRLHPPSSRGHPDLKRWHQADNGIFVLDPGIERNWRLKSQRQYRLHVCKNNGDLCATHWKLGHSFRWQNGNYGQAFPDSGIWLTARQ